MIKALYRDARAKLKLLFRRTPLPTVLMYHAIAEDGTFASVAPDAFARQMGWLKDNGWEVVPLGECLRRAEAGERGRFCALTFDDGYRDFLTAALPVLQSFGFPATVFLIAGKMGGSYAMSGGGETPLMTWDEARSCLKVPGVEIGSHAMTHRKLTKLSLEEARAEIVASREAIMRELGPSSSAWFCYPKGARNPAIADMVKVAGYAGAVAVDPGHPSAGTGRFAVPRGLAYGTMTPSEFAALFV